LAQLQLQLMEHAMHQVSIHIQVQVSCCTNEAGLQLSPSGTIKVTICVTGGATAAAGTFISGL
jgi:hypothetical protein